MFDIRKEFNYHRTGLEHKHCRSFIVLEHHYGRRDVMWKRSILSVFNLVLDIHVIVNWQLSQRYPLTSVTRLYRGFRFITHGDDVVFKLSANQQRARPIFERWNSVCFLLKAKNKFLEKDISQNIPREIRFWPWLICLLQRNTFVCFAREHGLLFLVVNCFWSQESVRILPCHFSSVTE